MGQTSSKSPVTETNPTPQTLGKEYDLNKITCTPQTAAENIDTLVKAAERSAYEKLTEPERRKRFANETVEKVKSLVESEDKYFAQVIQPINTGYSTYFYTKDYSRHGCESLMNTMTQVFKNNNVKNFTLSEEETQMAACKIVIKKSIPDADGQQ